MGMGGQGHVPDDVPPGRDSVSLVQEVRWAPEPVWTDAKNLDPIGLSLCLSVLYLSIT
jgi:hypothetical protein